jgi:class 3 adenylate cyclase
MSLHGTTPITEELNALLEQTTSDLNNLQLSSEIETASVKPRHASDLTYLRKPSKNMSSPIRSASQQAHRSSSPLARVNQCMQMLETHENAVFLFADMQGFTLRSQEMLPAALTQLLNEIYSDFLAIIESVGASSGIETVKFTGDCIMLAASSLDDTIRAQQVKAMVNVGWQLAQHISRLNEDRREDPINFRFGINVGPASKIRMCFNNGQGECIQYDWIGEGVNKAARMESSSLPNQIQITANVFEFIREDFECSECVHVVKSYEKPTTFFITCPKVRASSSKKAGPEHLIEDLALTLASPLRKRQSISLPSLSPSK